MAVVTSLFYAVATFLLSALVLAVVETNLGLYLADYPEPYATIVPICRLLLWAGPAFFGIAAVLSVIDRKIAAAKPG